MRLNTGRVRDQWHTMTRSGQSPRLANHSPEPFVEVHPTDAANAGLTEGGFARISSPYGECVLKVAVTDNQGEAVCSRRSIGATRPHRRPALAIWLRRRMIRIPVSLRPRPHRWQLSLWHLHIAAFCWRAHSRRCPRGRGGRVWPWRRAQGCCLRATNRRPLGVRAPLPCWEPTRSPNISTNLAASIAWRLSLKVGSWAVFSWKGRNGSAMGFGQGCLRE